MNIATNRNDGSYTAEVVRVFKKIVWLKNIRRDGLLVSNFQNCDGVNGLLPCNISAWELKNLEIKF